MDFRLNYILNQQYYYYIIKLAPLRLELRLRICRITLSDFTKASQSKCY